MTIHKKLEIIIPIIVLSAFGLFIVLKETDRKEKWKPENEKRYSVATITGYIPGAKTANSFQYTFDFKGKKYTSAQPILSEINLFPVERKKNYVGKKFLVIFVTQDPEYSKLLLNSPVTDTVEIPKNGWRKMPKI